jgi:hypothetical protein
MFKFFILFAAIVLTAATAHAFKIDRTVVVNHVDHGVQYDPSGCDRVYIESRRSTIS